MINVLEKSILSQCTHLYSIKLSSNLISIDGYAFQQTYLRTFDIPDSVRSIGENVFYNCSHLKSVTIGKGITTLNNLFKLSSISEFHIPSHITQINVKCFEAVPYIQVTIDKDHPVYYIKDNFIIRRVDNAIICSFGELPKTIQIPDEIEQINSITLNQKWEKANDGFGGEFYENYDKLPNIVILPESFVNGIPNEILGIKLVCYKGTYLLGQDYGEISSSAEIPTEYDASDKYPSNMMFDKEILGQNCNSKNYISKSKWRHINGLTTLEITLIVITILLFFVLIGFFVMFFVSSRKNKKKDSDSGFNQNQI
ncbi:surface antigen BspA-like [Trichomonas vaginalis G3]|uniref:Surface antigen BspA-like n=1 Tax=Trichomonas vaginalis (strain ATCC PRA-98 / G3) TaxID=412133 RepID=A2FIH9_TRIV3|nr:leucine-rich repeats (6 copies)-containing protein [Trichomonas vaginalis G3]EAX95296.1 surface antigen BspA-like [Trichomonas vaginalis G3]KAI5539352.1 leucine-rich repeats (6 copies)-containing protein [Trichomonas vaginalis G3]|eukprot:XP_001308226.1 surface antigen BspA-like [Trichomonas vaginalis G3]